MDNSVVITEFGDIPNDARLKILGYQAKLRMKKLEQASSYFVHSPVMFANFDSILEASKKLPKQYAKIDTALERFDKISEANLSYKDKIRKDFLKFQRELLERRVGESQEVIRQRKEYIKKIRTPEQIKLEMLKCKEDIFHWFDMYAMTIDPRNPVLFVSPFILFPKQREFVTALDESIFVTQEWLLVEKSRDEGISWTTMAYFVYRFLFPESDSSHFLIASMKAKDVDELGNPSTLMEKVRFLLKSLPEWMLPSGWDGKKNLTYFKITNPANGSTITGSTANPDTGRGGRYTAIAIDEAASVEKDEASITAASQSSNCIILISTPKGTQNEFYRLRHGGDHRVISFHWSQNPHKSEAWYNYQKLKLSVVMLAQEVDIDYELSQTGRIFPEWSEVHHVITWNEFAAEIANSFELGQQSFHIPRNWSRMRTHDWGSTGEMFEDHANITSWFATAPEGTVTKSGVDVSGCVFLYRVLIPNAHTTVNRVAAKVVELESPLRESERMYKQLMSHEQAATRDVYNQEHNLNYTAWKVGANMRDFGIARVRDYLELEQKEHPFRDFLDKAPRLFFIVAEGEGEAFWDEHSQRYKARPALTAAGLKRPRMEMATYHWDASGRVPDKYMDDFCDTLRGAGTEFPPKLRRDPADVFEESLPEQMRATAILAEPDRLKQGIDYLSRLEYERNRPQAGMSRFNRMLNKVKRNQRF